MTYFIVCRSNKIFKLSYPPLEMMCSCDELVETLESCLSDRELETVSARASSPLRSLCPLAVNLLFLDSDNVLESVYIGWGFSIRGSVK